MALFRKEGEERIAELLQEAETARMKGDVPKNKKALEEVIGLYTRASNYAAAAEIAEHLKDHSRAARYWFRSGDFKRAAKEHLAAGEHQAAVELFERSGDYMRAAEVLEEGGDLVRASMQYEKAGDRLRAADILWEALNAEGVTVSGSEAKEACKRAGDLYADLGRDEQAIDAYLKSGHVKLAAKTLERGGRHLEAIELLKAANDLLGAAEIARNASLEKEASILLAMRAENAGRLGEAAAHYEQAGNYAQAAMLYEYSGDMSRAAEAHERAGNLEVAASIYQRVGELQRAIRCLRAAGRDQEADSMGWDPDTSAIRESYNDGDYISAAEGFIAAARSGKPKHYQEAKDCLESIEPQQPAYLKARSLLAEITAEQGDKQGAIAILRPVIDGLTPTEEHCALLYQYGRLLESEGFIAEARDVYRNVVVLNPKHADVLDRMRYIADGGSGPKKPAFRTIVGTPASAPPTDDLSAVPNSEIYEEPTERVETGEILIEEQVKSLQRAGSYDSGELYGFNTQKSLEGLVLRKRFRIERQLGGGGQARVFLARDTVLHRPVAIKVLHESVAATEDGLEKFLREARLAARIHHPSCVAIFDFGHEHGLTFIAMEYIEGHPLSDALSGGALEVFRGLQIAKEVAEALNAAHEAGVVHRDVKPGNILLDEFDRVRLTDFGVASVIEGDNSESLFTGTPKYMSPEQANGDQVDSRTDIYSLGAVLYEMLAGEAPFDGTLASVAFRLTQPAPDLPATTNVPSSVRNLVKRCLKRDRKKRPKSCTAMIKELDRALAEVTKMTMTRNTI